MTVRSQSLPFYLVNLKNHEGFTDVAIRPGFHISGGILRGTTIEDNKVIIPTNSILFIIEKKKV